MYENERRELTDICRLLYDRNLVAASDGNVSLRVSPEHILLTPSGKNKGFLEPGQMLVVDFEGHVAEGEGKPSKEYPMHRAVYLGRSDAGAVVHTHPVFATAFAMAGKNIPDNYLIETRMMLKGVSLAPYAQPGTLALAESIVPFLTKGNAVLLQNHGAVTWGKNGMDAFNKMEVLETVAKTIIMSAKLGAPVPISEEELAKMG
ncbi:MAG: class II aldolase/adducin family protein [Eubacteriales bacterium]|nr:class II aldolase/adducin family protein [Eubacteriales bacterium]